MVKCLHIISESLGIFYSNVKHKNELSISQARLIQRLLAQNYFLLWGPVVMNRLSLETCGSSISS